ncbi:hemerythrin domain-containing protein [Paracoccus sediminicola]|uniref:hemerythrin domain-containing protein n=1 Tax=Paracoccus sediminicola TaxID=3017783 RepID=UPI0022F04A97|nr:hemerythrin domain-containing protein [Paracoccus sediminicola]WBU58749.1 hemerythrin domain-containing protein [Paracoccus sediminicola]
MQKTEHIHLKCSDSPQEYELLILRQEQVCFDLEMLADQLPYRVDTLAAKKLADTLHPTLRACQDLEEAHVFPAILRQNVAIGPTVARLRAEHAEDEDHAVMVAESVMRFIRSDCRSDADGLGYLIRGLFQPLLRHSAFDRTVILPLYLQATPDSG